MAVETVQTYKISFKFDESLNKLQSMQQKMKSFNKIQEASLKRQISLQKQLSKGGGIGGGSRAGGAPGGPGQSKLRASQTALADILKKEEAIARVERKRVKALNDARDAVKRTAFWLDESKDDAQAAAKAAVKERIAKAGTAKEVRLILAQEKASLRASRARTSQLRKQSFLMKKMASSSRQVAGNMVSAFAVVAGIGAITRVGQEIESVENALLSVSGSSEKAAENFKFVRNEAFRLGASLKSTAKDYAKLLASSKNQISQDESEELLTGILEASTVLGLSADDTSGAIRALQQMLGKTKVTSEELRLQLAERLPGAVQLMATAAQKAGLIGREVPKGQIVSEMEKLMKAGKLLARDVLPFFSKELSKFAAPGITKALNSNRVAMGRLVFSMQEAANEIFKGGFGQGLSDFFNASAKFIRENSDLWKAFGAILGSVFKGLAAIINFLRPIFSAIGTVLKGITDLLGDFAGGLAVLASSFGPAGKFVVSFIKRLGGLRIVLALATASLLAFLSPVLLIITALGILEELFNFFSGGDKVGLFLNTRSDIAKKAKGLEAARSLKKDTPTIINNTISLNVDGETIAESVSRSSSFDSLIEGKMFHNLQAL